jgi:hypothetical protein
LVGSEVEVATLVADGLGRVTVGGAGDGEGGTGMVVAVVPEVGGIGNGELSPAAGVNAGLVEGLVGGEVTVDVATTSEGVPEPDVLTVVVARMTWATGAEVGAAPNRSHTPTAARATMTAPSRSRRPRGRPERPPPPSAFRPALAFCTGFTDVSLSILDHTLTYTGYCGIFPPFVASV